MASIRSWKAYPPTYRAREVGILAGWIRAGESAAVVGLAGAGKSNLLGFLCHRPEVLRSHWPDNDLKLSLVQVDLNNLPGNDLATFYRLILRALCEARVQLAAVEPSLAATVETLYRKVEDKADPFLSQSALREALSLFQQNGARLVLVLDPFDQFCRTATPQIFDNMRGLRDSFKTILSYLVGVRYELAHLRDPLEMGELYEILDTHVCWLGAMAEEDARWVINQVEETIGQSFEEKETERLIDLTGCYPALLRAAALWLAKVPSAPKPEAWTEALLAERGIQNRLEEMWAGLTQEEQRVLSEIQKLQTQVAALAAEDSQALQNRAKALNTAFEGLTRGHRRALRRLAATGLCQRAVRGWCICSDLLAIYVANVEGRGADKIWLDEKTEELYQGQTALDSLTPLEWSVLRFLAKRPRIRHTKTDLIINAWPDELRREGVTDDSLYQVIRGLRKRIEPNPSKPCFIITWRGTGSQEGGYQFFPEGRAG